MGKRSRGHTLAPESYGFADDFVQYDERRCFHYFRDRTAYQLAGCFSSDFWSRLVPLSTRHSPAIKHAVIALASLHERFESDDSSILGSNNDVSQGGFALQQYTRAISHLNRSINTKGQQPMDMYLVACILFACFEVRYVLLLCNLVAVV